VPALRRCTARDRRTGDARTRALRIGRRARDSPREVCLPKLRRRRHDCAGARPRDREGLARSGFLGTRRGRALWPAHARQPAREEIRLGGAFALLQCARALDENAGQNPAADSSAPLDRERVRARTLRRRHAGHDRQSRPGPGSRPGRVWIYLDRAGRHAYDFSDSRKSDRPQSILAGYRDAIHADVYPGYDQLFAQGGATEVACWAHTLRKFVDAESGEAKLAKVEAEREAALAHFAGR